jgi:DNA-binding GntR family transcriptional regulator
MQDGDGWRISGPDGSVRLSGDQAVLMARHILRSEPDEPGARSPEPSDTSETLTQRVLRLIQEDLGIGNFVPGQRLDEASLAQRYGVSRTPVREALTQLAASGLIVRQPRRGCRVAGISRAAE